MKSYILKIGDKSMSSINGEIIMLRSTYMALATGLMGRGPNKVNSKAWWRGQSAEIRLSLAYGTRRIGRLAYMTPIMSILDDWPEQAPKRPIHWPVPLTFRPDRASLTWRYKAVGAYITTTTAVRRQIKVAGRRKTVTEIRTHEDREGHRVELAFGTHGPSLQEVADALAVERFMRKAKGQPVMTPAAGGRGRLKVMGSVWRSAA
jgi:hypothetical protein